VRRYCLAGSLILVAACAPRRAPVAFDLRAAGATGASAAATTNGEEYSPVPPKAAAILGCDVSPASPVCVVAPPSAEEDSAFRAEGARLSRHADPRCRKLGAAIISSENAIRMYPRALVRRSGGETLYGVGHAYELGDEWLIRIARRIDDLNERTLDEKKRTLRHEMSHTIGATETIGFGWTAEDYASRCA
jgi:hypothetical protein